MKREIAVKLKRLKELVDALDVNLIDSGFRVTASEHGVYINQFFAYNIPNIISACQGLLRGESTERHHLRLAKDFENVFSNLDKLRTVSLAEVYVAEIGEIESILKELNQIYLEI